MPSKYRLAPTSVITANSNIVLQSIDLTVPRGRKLPWKLMQYVKPAIGGETPEQQLRFGEGFIELPDASCCQDQSEMAAVSLNSVDHYQVTIGKNRYPVIALEARRKAIFGSFICFGIIPRLLCVHTLDIPGIASIHHRPLGRVYKAPKHPRY